MNILIISILWFTGCTALCLLNARFWTLFADLESNEEKEAKARNIAPVMPNTPIPMKHKIAYVRDWVILVVVISFVVWLVCNSID